MARRKKSDDAAGGALVVLFTLVAITIVLFTIASLPVLIAGWLYFKKQGEKLPQPHSLSDFVHTPYESELMVDIGNMVTAHSQDLAALWEQGTDLSKRQDGYFNERSNLAKELNPKIQETENLLFSSKRALEALKALPVIRVNHYLKIQGWAERFKLALITYPICMVLLLIVPMGWVHSFSLFLNEYGMLGALFGFENLWGVMAVSSFASIGALYVSASKVHSNLINVLDEAESQGDQGAIDFTVKYASATGIGELE